MLLTQSTFPLPDNILQLPVPLDLQIQSNLQQLLERDRSRSELQRQTRPCDDHDKRIFILKQRFEMQRLHQNKRTNGVYAALYLYNIRIGSYMMPYYGDCRLKKNNNGIQFIQFYMGYSFSYCGCACLFVFYNQPPLPSTSIYLLLILQQTIYAVKVIHNGCKK